MEKINPLIFRAYDIRGIAHKPESEKKADLTPETMRLIGQASGSYFLEHYGSNIALGHDCRESAPELVAAFVEGILSTGCDVTQLGMIPTPMLYFAVCEKQFDGGACITASHNPKEYNGVKLVAKGAHSICGDELQDVLKIIQSGNFKTGSGQLKKANISEQYMEKLSQLAPLNTPLKIVVDAGNGAAGPYIRPFFEKLGCDVTALYEEPDGRFPNHPANPEELENMQDLIAEVKAQNADLGIAFDGDADRVGLVDEKGQHHSADLLLLHLARQQLKQTPGAKVVFDVKVSQVLIDDIAAHGGIPHMTKTGHSFIESTMHAEGAPLGGEISGHMFFADNYYGFDDAFLAAAKLLQIASSSEGPASQLFDSLPKTATTPELKTPCPDTEKFRIVSALSEHFTKNYDCITIDGVRVNFDEKSWGAVRASNTSPNLTIRFEAPNHERLKEIIAIMLSELQKYPELDLWWADTDFSQ